jgi:hypothetical protein
MNQAVFQGFGPSDHAVCKWRPPVDMSDDVVTLCCQGNDRQAAMAAAVVHSLNFARARYGFRQEDVAKRTGWESGSFLNEIAKGHKAMPEARIENFLLATGCNLLKQVIERKRLEERITGRETPNERNRAVLAAMLRCA